MPLARRPTVKVHLDSIGEVSLYPFTSGATDKFFEIVAKGDVTDKEFVQDILFHQLFSPKMTEEEFDQIPDEDLKKIAVAVIKTEDYIFKDYIDIGNVFLDFRKVIVNYVQKEEIRIRETFGSFNKDIEELAKMVQVSLTSQVGKSLLKTSPEMNVALNSALDVASHVHFQPLQILTSENNKQAIALFSRYWEDYYALNEKITTNVFATFEAQNLLSPKNLAKDVQKALQLSIKNERTFTDQIGEINNYPEEQRSILYEKAGIKFFSIGEFEAILQKIKRSVEIHSQLMFWSARTKGKLAGNLERIAQGHMMGLLYMGLPDRLVAGFQQLGSGSGIIDILIIFPNEHGEQQKVILELKVFEEGHRLNDGIEQTAQYMGNEKTEYGYRVLFNATDGVLEMQEKLSDNGKKVKDIVININLPNPSLLDKKKIRNKTKK